MLYPEDRRLELFGVFPSEVKELAMNESHTSPQVPNESDPPQIVRALEGRQVLLVEDCPDQQRLYLRFLQRAGADVTLECYGQSAVETVEESPHTFDAVVMDLELPGMDGIEATRRLRELGFEGAIIAVTAYGSEERQQSWVQAGCSAYLEKPLAEQLLVGSISQYSTQQHSTTARETVQS